MVSQSLGRLPKRVVNTFLKAGFPIVVCTLAEMACNSSRLGGVLFSTGNQHRLLRMHRSAAPKA